MGLLIITLLMGLLMAQDDGLKAYQSGDYDNARKYYESILNEKDEDAAAQFGLGTTAFQQQDLKGALDAFQRALETDNKELQYKAYYNMANLMASQQKNEEALVFYRKALELNPTDKDAKHNYEIIRYQQKQDQQKQDQQGENDENQEQQQNQDQQQDQNGEKKEDQQNQEDQKNNEEEQGQNKQNEQGREEEKSQEEKEQEQQQAQDDQEKQQDLQNAQAILDALKKDEKVNQKRQMVKARSKKMEKDW